MTTLNDEILRATGGPTVNDGLLAYYQTNGATSDDLQDAEREFLIAAGALGAGSNQDLWLDLLPGATSLQDRQLVYWTAQP
jgi:hypothetical protein